MKDNREFIDGIYKKYEEELKDSDIKLKEKKKRTLKIALKLISSVAVLLVISTIIIHKEREISTNIETESKLLSSVGTFDNFYKIMNEYSTKEKLSNYFSSEILIEDATIEQSSDTLNSASKTESYSQTNTQVSNVDEADVVKTDGENIYYATYDKLVIVDAKDPNNLKEIYKEEFEESNFRPQELYVYGDRLIVLGNTYINSGDVLKTYSATTENYISYKNKTCAIIYDLSGEVKRIREIDLTGNLLSSRMIDGYLYIISTQYINAYNIKNTPIAELSEDMYKPTYKDTAVSQDEKKIGFDQIEYFEDFETANILSVATLKVDNNEEAKIKTFLGSGEEIYVSEDNMYIVKTNSNYNILTREVTTSSTTILKFSLDGINVNYKAEAEVPGYINNQFSMDESNGTFKIATTVGAIWNLTDYTTNALYILDENLNEIGRIEGLAKGEKIYSVRYTKDKAYIVTYKQVDPLFVIDISNPRVPTLLGELKIEGYSTYLHPYDENHLIGFGYDTTFNGKTTTTNGLKMVMFDITDLSNPKELFKVEIGDRSTSSPLTYNHKALLFSKEKNIIAFPTSNYKNKNKYKAQIYDIDLEKGFTLKGEITSSDNNYKYQIERIIYINNSYYTISQQEIKAVDMETLEEINSIEI